MEITKELAIIALTLYDEDAAVKIFEKITPDMFTMNRYQTVYKTALELFKEENKVDIVRLIESVPESSEHKEILRNEFIQVSKEEITLKAYKNDIDRILNDFVDADLKAKLLNAAMTSGTSEELISNVTSVYNDNSGRLETSKDITNAEYLRNSFFKELEEFQKQPVISTGFKNLDEQIGGGIYAGLYVLGAISSLGKTTLIHQIADNIARAGTPVLYFSLEMSRLELITKSISRINAQEALEAGVKGYELAEHCKPSIYFRTHGINTENGKKALQTYADTIAENISIIQGDFGTDVSEIRNYCSRFIRNRADGIRPIVIIDYLQIIKPVSDSKGTTKDNIDFTVSELKRLSRDFGIAVIVISSFNRANYSTKVSFESFKESGGIEYTADVVMGLQLTALDEHEVFEKDTGINKKREIIEKAKAENPRRIQLKGLKNRYGKAVFQCQFAYNPMYDLFVPTDTPMEKANAAGATSLSGRKGTTKKKAGLSLEDIKPKERYNTELL